MVAPNLTPDPQTGHITAWTEEAFVARFKAGRVYKGSCAPRDRDRRHRARDQRSPALYENRAVTSPRLPLPIWTFIDRVPSSGCHASRV